MVLLSRKPSTATTFGIDHDGESTFNRWEHIHEQLTRKQTRSGFHESDHGISDGINSIENDAEPVDSFSSYGFYDFHPMTPCGDPEDTDLIRNLTATFRIKEETNGQWKVQYNRLLGTLGVACGVGAFLLFALSVLLVVRYRLKK